jgi:hypothetical protein
MPSGWSVEKSSSSGGVGCLHHSFAPPESHQTASAEVTFTSKSGLELVEERLATFSIPGDQAFAKITGLFDSCKRVDAKSGGAEVTGTVKHLALPGYGNQSAGYVVTLTSRGETVVDDLVVVHRGTILLGLEDGAFKAPALDQFERLVKLALAKIPG